MMSNTILHGLLLVLPLIFNGIYGKEIDIAAQMNVNTRYTYNVVTDFTNLPYIASLYDPTVLVFYGFGAVLNTNYILFRAQEGKEVENLLAAVFLYVNLENTNTLTPADTQYQIKEIKYHPDYVAGEYTADIALFHVCDNIVLSTYATIPDNTFTYPDWAAIDFVIYQSDGATGRGTIGIASDQIGEFNVDNFDATKHYCCQASDSEWGTVIPRPATLMNAPFMVKDNKFAGFVVNTGVYSDIFLGDYVTYAVQRLQAVKTWIDANSVI